MVSDRKTAKDAVIKSGEDDPELDSALANAADHQLNLKREDNRHKETINQQNLGSLGGLVGDGKNIPTLAAFMTVALSGLLAVGLYVAAYMQAENAELWSRSAERTLAVALAALAYVFGKGNK